VCVDLIKLDQLLSVDLESLSVRVQGGAHDTRRRYVQALQDKMAQQMKAQEIFAEPCTVWQRSALVGPPAALGRVHRATFVSFCFYGADMGV
jgi:hypothetical protein